MSDTVEQVKSRLSVVDVVSVYVKLTKAGKHYKGLCPFHKEKSSSFMVSPDRGFYHCFGCGKGGDIFTFIEEMEGVDFKGALKILAEKAGVSLVYEKGGDSKDILYRALSAAQEFYTSELGTNRAAREYLTGRGLSTASITAWSLGYAPKEWRALTEHLRAAGFHDRDLLRAGLAKRKEGATGIYDTFRGRIMFPIRDVSGRVVAFTGRIFPEEADSAKYLNSPETEVFEKGRLLYGMDSAREWIRKYDFAILVEGQVDLLMVRQVGYGTAVALSGTAFTEAHAALIGRYTKNLVIAFDGDRAGVTAAGRAAAIGLTAGMDVKIAAMPPGEDPADVVRRDPLLWKRAVKEAVHVVDFYLAYLKDLGYDTRRFGLEVTATVLPYVALVTNAIDQAHFIKRVAEAVGVPEESVVAELKKQAAPMTTSATNARTASVPTEHLILALTDETGLASLAPDDQRAALAAAALFEERFPDATDRAAALQDLTLARDREQTRDRYRTILAELREAERANDQTRAQGLMADLATLAKTL